jgi:hypothetical protein
VAFLAGTDKATETFGIAELLMRPRGSRDCYTVPTDFKGSKIIYFTPSAEYRKNYVSAVDVINGTVYPETLSAKWLKMRLPTSPSFTICIWSASRVSRPSAGRKLGYRLRRDQQII